MKIISTKMSFGPVAKFESRYSDGSGTGVIEWGCEITVGESTRTLFASGHPRKADFLGELREVRRGSHGVRASDTTPTAWLLVPASIDCAGAVYVCDKVA